MARELGRCRGKEIFKELKSYYRMDKIPSENPNRPIINGSTWMYGAETGYAHIIQYLSRSMMRS